MLWSCNTKPSKESNPLQLFIITNSIDYPNFTTCHFITQNKQKKSIPKDLMRIAIDRLHSCQNWLSMPLSHCYEHVKSMAGDQIVPMASSIQRSRPFWNHLVCKTPQISMKLCRCGPERWILIPRNFEMTAWLPGLSPRGVTQESNHTPTQQSPDDLIDANRIQNPAMPSSNALMQSPLFPKGMNSISTNSISQTTFIDCRGVNIQQNNKLDSKAWMHTSDATLGKFNPKFPAETQTP